MGRLSFSVSASRPHSKLTGFKVTQVRGGFLTVVSGVKADRCANTADEVNQVRHDERKKGQEV